MRAVQSLPEGYREYEHIDLQKDKKTSLKVNGFGAVLMIALFIAGHCFFVPFTTLFNTDDGLGLTLFRCGALLLGYFAYIVLHELTHAAAMKTFGGRRLRFGFTGLYAYAGSEHDYFDKPAYIAVALAPVAVWGVIFTILLCVVPTDWFWVVYFLQVGNIAGAAGDFYVTFRSLRMPKDILVMDTGVEMFIYSKTVK